MYHSNSGNGGFGITANGKSIGEVRAKWNEKFNLG